MRETSPGIETPLPLCVRLSTRHATRRANDIDGIEAQDIGTVAETATIVV